MRREPLLVALTLSVAILFLAIAFFLRDRQAMVRPAAIQPRSPTVAPEQGTTGQEFLLATWNVRGYPEKSSDDTSWLHYELKRLGLDVLCVQEVASLRKASQFCSTDERLTQFAFTDWGDAMGNAMFAGESVALEKIQAPAGFQHPPQIAYLSYQGFDAVVVSLHLSWTDVSQRGQEKVRLRTLTSAMLTRDPDVILAGDFNAEGSEMERLATDIGLRVMTPTNASRGTTQAGHCYDHLMVSPDLAEEEAISARIETFTGEDLDTSRRVSDHLPVVGRFRTEEQFRDRPKGQ